MSLLLYPGSSGLEWLGMTHGMGEGASGFTCIVPISIQDSTMLPVDNFRLYIYDYD